MGLQSETVAGREIRRGSETSLSERKVSWKSKVGEGEDQELLNVKGMGTEEKSTDKRVLPIVTGNVWRTAEDEEKIAEDAL